MSKESTVTGMRLITEMIGRCSVLSLEGIQTEISGVRME